MARPSQGEIMAELGLPGHVVSSGGTAPPSGTSDLGNSLDNDPTMEGLWAMKAMEHAEIHFNLLCAIDPKLLKLTPKDDMIYSAFRKDFADFSVDKLVEEELKSKASKEKWRPFMQIFEKEIEDFNFATLVRINPLDEYSQENTILVTRIQFLCIEIARNREGKNDSIRTNFKPKPRTKKAQS